MPAVASTLARHIRRWPRRVAWTVAAIVVLLVAARVAAPFAIRRAVNARLAEIPGYTGSVDSIGLSLLRGAYTIEGIAIYRQQGLVREPFFLARRIDFSLAWRELLHRKIVSDIAVDGGDLTFVQAPTKEESQKNIDRRWQSVVKDLFPIDITHVEWTDGTIRYEDKTKRPPVDVFVTHMHLVADGLRNRPADTGVEFPAEIRIDGESLGGGNLGLVLVAEPLAPQPHFHASFKIRNVNLPALNESLKAIANVDVSRGKFEMVGEMAGKDGGFQGYVKPFFRDLDFHNLNDRHESIGTRIWEHIVAGLAWLVKNKSTEQVATRIPFEGRFGDPKLGLWTTITNTFRHGFVRAFHPNIEHTVHADNVLPSGKSATGPDVTDIKRDNPPPAAAQNPPNSTGAGAPTGRPSRPRNNENQSNEDLQKK